MGPWHDTHKPRNTNLGKVYGYDPVEKAFQCIIKKYNSTIKLPQCLPCKVQWLPWHVTHTSSHQLRDLNAKPVANCITGKTLCTITCDYRV